MVEVLITISIIVAVSALLTIIAKLIKQPPIIAYLFAGILVGPLFLNLIGENSGEVIQLFAHIGVAFLLFIVGLSLDIKILKEIGKVSIFAGLAEIIITGGIGVAIAIGIGFNNISALYIGAALAFSSTVLVVKILSDKKEIETLHGRLALGILIIEDFVAAIMLMIIPLISDGSFSSEILFKLLIGIGIIIAVFLISHYVLPFILNLLAKSQETLFLFGISWALLFASLFSYMGFSLEIGALIAGMSLASSKYNLDLGSKIKPMRDFFIVLFFVFFGSRLAGTISPEMIKYALLFSVFILIGKPLIVMSILKMFGYRKRTNFLAGSSIAQISEFSLIIVLLGYTLGHLSQDVMSLAVLIAIITIGLSSYSIYYSHYIFNKLSGLLNIFEGRKLENLREQEKHYDVILFGYHRIGYKLLQALKRMKIKFAVVDYNPKVIISLSKQKIDCFFGDASDKNFLDEIGLEKTDVIISTIPEESANIAILEMLKEKKINPIFIGTSEQPRYALDLYRAGADYVIIPQHLGGWYASEIIEKYGKDKKKYREMGRNHLHELESAKNSSNFNS